MAKIMSAGYNIRSLSLDVIFDVLEGDAFSNKRIDYIIKSKNPDNKDRVFFTRLCLGTIEKKLFCDSIISEYSKTPLRKIRPIIRCILRMSVYQIFFMDSVPDAAAVDEAVKLTKKRGLSGLKGFVNGILRNVLRDKSEILQREFDISITYGIKKDIIDMWEAYYGYDVAKSICSGFVRSEGITVSLLSKVKDIGEWIGSCEKMEINIRPIEDLKYVYHLSNIPRIHEIPGFKEGYFYIQDESSIVGISKANPKRGMKLIDVCGAPGGKSIYAMSLMDADGEIDIRDISEKKLDIIRENVIRSGYTNIKEKKWDATVLDKEAVGVYDLVIADLPCSGLGVISKKPEIRYRISSDDIEYLSNLQRTILSNAKEYVKAGGKLLYSTCTISPKENEENTKWFLNNNDDFTLEEEKLILPGGSGRDGFYYAIAKKRY